MVTSVALARLKPFFVTSNKKKLRKEFDKTTLTFTMTHKTNKRHTKTVQKPNQRHGHTESNKKLIYPPFGKGIKLSVVAAGSGVYR